MVAAAPPLVVLGPDVMVPRRNEPAAELVDLRFELGRLVELTRPRRVLATGTPPDAFITLCAALSHAFGPPAAGALAPDPEVAREAERLKAALPIQTRRFVSDYLATTGPLDARGYLAACERAADRAGLIACTRADVAIRLAGGAAVAQHIVRLAASPRYLSLRRRLTRRGVSQGRKST